MAYSERLVAAGAVVWASTGATGVQRILPDGCLDLLVDGDRLVVAGPDTTARLHCSSSPHPVIGLRLHAGLGPALLGVPADELTDTTVALDALWGDRRARHLTAVVGPDPTGLSRWASAQVRASVGPLGTGATFDTAFGARLLNLLASGAGVGAAAAALGYSPRQLHRRTLPLFGYGPQHLARVLRLQRALVALEGGLGWAGSAAGAGYADQAHLSRDVRALTGVTPTVLRRERDVRSVQDAAQRAD
ncbi:MAG: helix-turn-helix domain-containing protein [Lapillicoccus sp.]